MSYFDKIYKEIFSKKKSPEYNGKKYLVQEMYSLSEADKKGYENWLNNSESSILINNVLSGIKHKKAGLSEYNDRFSIYESAQSNGFYVLCENFLDTKTTIFLQEAIKDQIVNIGYYQNHSSKDVYEENSNVKTKITYYLKPRLSEYELPLDQKYGNVHIECLFINDKPDYIKLMANIYSDRNYKEAESFDDLLTALSNS